MFTSTVKDADCPRCGAKKGEDCRTPKGRKTWPPHNDRIQTYQDAIGPDEVNRRHAVPAMTFEDLFKNLKREL